MHAGDGAGGAVFVVSSWRPSGSRYAFIRVVDQVMDRSRTLSGIAGPIEPVCGGWRRIRKKTVQEQGKSISGCPVKIGEVKVVTRR